MDIRIESVFVGRPQSFPSEGDSTPWTSAIVKQRVDGPVYVRTTNIDGDLHAELVHHGGTEQAFVRMLLQNYACWLPEFPSTDCQAGCFGETLLCKCRESVSASTIKRFAVFSVSQPRQPCWKLSRHWKLPKLAVRVQQTRRTGWYFRVLNEGLLESGQVMKLIDRTYPRWTIAAANDVMFAKPRNSENDQKLAACPLLSSSWRETLRTRARSSEHKINENEQRRLGNLDP